MIEIVKVTAQDFPAIQDIAYKTWPATYGHILSAGQLEYMLDMMYSMASLQKSAAKGHQFLLLKEDNTALGFASYELNYTSGTTKLHKLYVLPETQGRGAGRLLISKIENAAKSNGNDKIVLNVNRYNNAANFYLKNGFTKAGEEDINIGNGYLMEDFIMEKGL